MKGIPNLTFNDKGVPCFDGVALPGVTDFDLERRLEDKGIATITITFCVMMRAGREDNPDIGESGG